MITAARRQAGFTLIELLIVLAITGMLTALIAGGFHGINGAWQRLAGRDAATQQFDAARNFLRGLLSQCYPEMARGTDGRMGLSFAGSADEIRFLGPLPQRFGTDDIVQYRLRLTKGGALVLGWRFDRDYADDGVAGAWAELPVLDGIAHGSFWYFGPASAQDTPIWHTSWPRRDMLPSLIDIRVQGAGLPANILAAPRVTAVFCKQADQSLCRT